MSINLTQAILIQAGILLQVVAICAFVRQRVNSARMLPPHGGTFSIKKKAKGEETPHQATQKMNLKNWSPTRGTAGMGAHHFSQRQ